MPSQNSGPMTDLYSLPAAGKLQHENSATRQAVGAKVRETLAGLPVSFEENRGQTDSQVKFLARGQGFTLFLTSSEAVLSLQRQTGTVERSERSPVINQEVQEQIVTLRMGLINAAREPRITGLDELTARVSYFTGSDPQKWQTGIVQYAKVRYESVYPGIDLIWYGNQQQMEYDFVVAPGADPRLIRLNFSGAEKIRLSPDGDLILRVAGEEIRQHRPVIYQEVSGQRREIAGRYVLTAGNQAGFEIANYDRSLPLIIDPVLIYSSYFGGSFSPADDSASDVAVDADGKIYLCGGTTARRFPGTSQIQFSSGAFVTKLNPERAGAAAIEFSYFLSSAAANAIAVDRAGLVYVTGNAFSSGFPVRNPFQNYQGRTDAFLAVINTTRPVQDALVFSTFLGGSDDDFSVELAVDDAGQAYLVGDTVSDDFPLRNEYQSQRRGKDAFVARINTAGGPTALQYSTRFGGSGQDVGHAIAVDAAGFTYFGGYTDSADFPVLNQLQKDQPAGDGFVTKLDTRRSGTAALLYSTYLGGNNTDNILGLAVDVNDDQSVYVTGETYSSDFPLRNQFQTYQSGGDAFLTRLDTTSAGSTSLIYSTYLGGSDYDVGQNVAVDGTGRAYIIGGTRSTNFPTAGEYQKDQGGDDAFVTVLHTRVPGPASLTYSTYLGTGGQDRGWGIVTDRRGLIIVVGDTDSDGFPLTQPAQTYQGRRDVFIARLNSLLRGAPSLNYATYLGGSNAESRARDIALDPAGFVYVTGDTNTPDFPTRSRLQGHHANSRDPVFASRDAFVLKIDPARSGSSSLLFSTYLGGGETDSGGSIRADGQGNIYVSGYTASTDFPTRNAYQNSFRGRLDGFIIRLDASQSDNVRLVWSTYLGGSDFDDAVDIAADENGQVYVTGYTGSPDFPTLNEYQPDQGEQDAFVARLDTNRSGPASLRYSTYLGGSKGGFTGGLGEGGSDIETDGNGIVYVTGQTDSPDFPTLNEYQNDRPGNDAFLTVVDTGKSGSASLLYSTYFGGSGEETASEIDADSSGTVYILGNTTSDNLPVRNGIQGYRGNRDIFIARFDPRQAGDASLLFSTYLGGSNRDFDDGLAADDHGQVCVTGVTDSTDFPLVKPYQQYQGGEDVFIACINTRLAGRSALTFSTYLGGSGDDRAAALTLDRFGRIYLAGSTSSPDFPLRNEYQDFPGVPSAFVVLLRAATEADLAVRMLTTTSSVAPGGRLNLTTYVTNTGPDTATAVVVRQQFPFTVAVRGCQAGNGGACQPEPVTINPLARLTGYFYRIEIPKLAPGETAQIRMSLQINPFTPASSVVLTRATVSSDAGDPNTSNNSTDRTISIRP
ncbi:MAG: SBBP repeat-containing protein [Blastocatellia bacterium]